MVVAADGMNPSLLSFLLKGDVVSSVRNWVWFWVWVKAHWGKSIEPKGHESLEKYYSVVC